MSTVGANAYAAATPLPLGSSSDPTSISGRAAGTASPYFPAWWSFTPAADGIVVLDTFATVPVAGGDPDTLLKVYTGADEATATLVASNDDYGQGYLSLAQLQVTSGTTYHVKIGTYGADGSGVDSYVLRTSISNKYQLAAADDDNSSNMAVFSETSPGLPAQSVPSAVSSYTDDELSTDYGLHRGAWWQFHPDVAGTLVVDAAASIGDVANLGIVVRKGPNSGGGSYNLTTPFKQGTGGAALGFEYEAGRYYYIGVGVTVDDGSVSDYVLSAQGPVAGDWRDDSTPVWDAVDESRTSNRVSAYYSSGRTEDDTPEAWDAAARAAWAGTGTVETQTSSDAPHLGVDLFGGVTVAQWMAVWVTLIRSGTRTISEGKLPPGVEDADGNFVDPNVIGVEWEPTSTAVDQQLAVTLGAAGFGLTPPDVPAGEPAYVKLGTYGGGVYAPGFLSGATVAGHQTLATVTPTVDGGEATATITSLPGNPNDDLTVAVTIIDQATQSQTPPPYPVPPHPSWGRYTPLRASLQTAYAPRYRLLYATPPSTPPTTVAVRKVVRLFPRDGDGYGF